MSATTLPRRPRAIGSRRTITVVASLYNTELSNALVDSTNNELVRIMPTVHVPVFRVPGAFEIPVCIKYLLENQKCDAIVALGVIIRGETGHADLVASSVTEKLQSLAVESGTPIIHEVLLVDNAEQARERCMGEKNRGVEAARAAVTMTELFAKLDAANASTVNRKPVVATANG